MSDREEFEESAARLGYSLTMAEHETGEYHYPVTQNAWDIWQEATEKAARAQEGGEAVPEHIAAQIERTDWTPEEALRWYSEGKHFDVVNGRTRIIDAGSVASNALKHLSLQYLEMRGDSELFELRQAPKTTLYVPADWRKALAKAVSMMKQSGFSPAQDSFNPVMAWLYDAESLLSAIPPADKPEGEWVRREDRLPIESDGDYNEDVWAYDKALGKAVMTMWTDVDMVPEYTHWKPTGLKRPTPPQEQ